MIITHCFYGEEAPALFKFMENRQIAQPQLIIPESGGPLLIWREEKDLYSAKIGKGHSEPPIRLNETPGSVEAFNHSSCRAATAIGKGNRVAISWTDVKKGGLMAVISNDGGQTFSKPVKLNSNENKCYQAFSVIAFDKTGTLHAIWIDGRHAPEGREEPANLYYARVENGEVQEKNLTKDQDFTICGCCRPDITARGDDLRIAFRNGSENGYRDIWRMEGSLRGEFKKPVRLGPPLWKIRGCPMSGPINAGEGTLWNDGSSGKRRLLSIKEPGDEYQTLLDAEQDGQLLWGPRSISGLEPDQHIILIPGEPGRLLKNKNNTWISVASDLPAWVVAGAITDGQIWFVGEEDGAFRFLKRATNF